MTTPISRMKYTIKKIKRMSPSEIAFRLNAKLLQAVEKQRWRRQNQNHSVGSKGAKSQKLTENLFAFASKMIPGADEAVLLDIQQRHPAIHSRLLERNNVLAASFHQGRWQLFDRSIDLTGPFDWHQDPGGGHRWERQFFTDLKIYNLEDGTDVKYVWELNRHQFLVELARSWLLKQDADSAGHVKRLLRDWIVENPLNEGVNWTSALEAAMRAVNWLHALAAMKDWAGWTADDKQTIAASLLDHATYLNNNLSIYSSPYNHLIGEASALLLLSHWLEGSCHAAAWRKKAIWILAQSGPAQFYPDGFTVEQAVGYHFYTLGFLIQAVIVNEHFGDPNNLTAVEAILEKAGLAGAAFKAPDGKWPAIGDMDSARSIPVYPEDYWDFTGLLSLMAVHLKSSALKSIAQLPGEELYWLMGADGLAEWDRLETAKTSSVHTLPDSGHIIAAFGKDDKHWLVFKAGPLGHGVHSDDTPSVAHGHADALQVLLYLNGQPALVDAGIPYYDGNPEKVCYFRTPAAHNTFEIKGVPWAKPAGGLAWSNVGPSPDLMSNMGEDVQVMAGVLRPGPGVVAMRYILALESLGLWITDVVVSDTPRSVCWRWQMPEERRPAVSHKDDRSGILIECVGCLLQINSNAPVVDAGVTIGGKDADSAWLAHGYGQMTPGARIHFQTGPQNHVMTTAFIGKEILPYLVNSKGVFRHV